MVCRFMATIDVARRLNCSPDRVRQLEREGKIHAEKMPRGTRVFRVEDVERLAAERERQKRERTAQ
jgi:DNA-binding transcriptional MerR regulator